jgi:hypothetical protein
MSKRNLITYATQDPGPRLRQKLDGARVIPDTGVWKLNDASFFRTNNSYREVGNQYPHLAGMSSLVDVHNEIDEASVSPIVRTILLHNPLTTVQTYRRGDVVFVHHMKAPIKQYKRHRVWEPFSHTTKKSLLNLNHPNGIVIAEPIRINANTTKVVAVTIRDASVVNVELENKARAVYKVFPKLEKLTGTSQLAPGDQFEIGFPNPDGDGKAEAEGDHEFHEPPIHTDFVHILHDLQDQFPLEVDMEAYNTASSQKATMEKNAPKFPEEYLNSIQDLVKKAEEALGGEIKDYALLFAGKDAKDSIEETLQSAFEQARHTAEQTKLFDIKTLYLDTDAEITKDEFWQPMEHWCDKNSPPRDLYKFTSALPMEEGKSLEQAKGTETLINTSYFNLLMLLGRYTLFTLKRDIDDRIAKTDRANQNIKYIREIATGLDTTSTDLNPEVKEMLKTLLHNIEEDTEDLSNSQDKLSTTLNKYITDLFPNRQPEVGSVAQAGGDAATIAKLRFTVIHPIKLQTTGHHEVDVHIHPTKMMYGAHTTSESFEVTAECRDKELELEY